MKKALILFLVLVMLGAGCLCYAHVTTVDDGDEVTFDETIMYGDPSAVEGVTVNVNTHCNDQLHWQTTYVAGAKPQVETDYQFTAQPVESEHIVTSNFDLNNYIDITFGDDHIDSSVEGLVKAYDELADKTAPGTERTETFLISDYIDYYPIHAYISLPDGAYFNTDAEIFYSSDGKTTVTYALQHLQDFFRIPVLPDEAIDFTVYKTPDGSVSTSGHGSSNTGDSYNMWSQGVFTHDRIYFSISTETNQGKYIDTSEIPGGYGLYMMPYSIYDDEAMKDNGNAYLEMNDFSVAEIHDDQLKMVYPLDVTTRVAYLETDAAEENLLMFTVEKDGGWLTVIDIDTMATVQRIQLSDDPQYAGFSLPRIFEDFIVVTVYGQYIERISVLTPSGDGKYDVQINVPLFNKDLEDNYKFFWRDRTDAYDWDGEKLIMCSPLNQVEGPITETPGFCLAVYDASGIQYFATYDSSLNTGSSTGAYDYYVRMIDDKPLKVEWPA